MATMENIFRFKILKGLFILIIATEIIAPCEANKFNGMQRERCHQGITVQEVSEYRRRLQALREEMQVRASVQGQEIDGYIVPIYDEHLSSETTQRDRRLEFLTGFTGTKGLAVITMNKAAFWTDQSYISQANNELDCEWKLFQFDGEVTVTDWIVSQLSAELRIGADPRLMPHFLWMEWERELYKNFLYLVRVNRNLVDIIWGSNRPPHVPKRLRVHEQRYAGEKWETKIANLREILRSENYDSIIVTSLTEIAYMLNLRGGDYPYTPVFKAYLVVTHNEIILYTNKTRVTLGIRLHLKSDPCLNQNCVNVREYNDVWRQLRTYAQIWKRVLVPTQCVYDMGASEAIHAALPVQIAIEAVSPIIFMRAQKNFVERSGMKTAHVRDGAAMCDVMSYLEERFALGETRTELEIKTEVERSRLSQRHSEGLSFGTIVAFGPHGALQKYITSNATDIEVTNDSTLIIDSGGQYLEGTTDVTRTFHFGEPTEEQCTAYTNILAGIIRLSTLKFPEDLPPSEIDTLSRTAIWGSMSDYPHGTGHGIGSFLSVKESPIDISYTSNRQFTFKEGYFFSNEPGFYKPGSFGIRLKNVLEVVDTGRRHPSGSRFLAFKEVTLVPYEPKLINRALLSAQEKRWLNEHNAKIRLLVGEELKTQGNMPAFYWMMNKTRHIREYLSEEDYRKSDASHTNSLIWNTISIIFRILICFQILQIL